ncbi:MAG: TonB-dependent receptor [Sphingomonadaceae bacterium]
MQRKLFRSGLLVSAALVILMPSPALSQDAPAAGGRGGEIVVTAQRRAQSLQDVPISMSQFSEDKLEQMSIRDASDLQFVSAGLSFQHESGASQIVLRGVGTGYSGPGLEGSVAIYLDGAYVSQQIGAAEDMLDIRQVQVLKGPQGALYGRNATGGAVLIDTNDPEIGALSGHVKAGFGNLDWMQTEAVLNLPLSDIAAVRFAGAWQDRDGYVYNVRSDTNINPYESYTFRSKLLIEPTDDLRIVLKAEHTKRDYGNTLRKEIATGPLCYYCNVAGVSPTERFYDTNQSSSAEQLASLPARQTFLRGDGDLENRVLTLGLQVDYSFGDMNLRSTTSYRRIRQRVLNDGDGAPVIGLFSFYGYDDGDYQALNEDLQISSDFGGAFDFIAGVQYQQDRNRFPLGLAGLDLGGLIPIADSRDRVKAYSGFAEIYYRFLDGFTLTLGGRYTHDKRVHLFSNNADGALAFGETSGRSSVKYDSFTPRAVLAYDAGNANYYISYNKGVKAGGFNSPGFNSTEPVRPEKIDAYEAGMKFVLLDRRLRLNLSAFHYDWKNLQVGFIDAGGGGIVQQNAAAAKNDGVEASIDWNVTDAFTINLNGLYQNARFTSFPNAAVFIPVHLNTPGGFGQVAGAEDIRGFRTPHAPKFSGNLGFNYYVVLGATGWGADVSANVAYKGRYDMAPGAGGPARLAREGDYAIANARLAFTGPDEQTTIALWADNITKTKYYNNIVVSTYGAYAEQALPRTYGISITQKF